MKGMPLPITGSGEETRDFAYVDDLVDGMLRAAYFEEAVGKPANRCRVTGRAYRSFHPG